MTNHNDELFWAKVQALTTIQETAAHQLDMQHAEIATLGEIARLLNETLKDARADRLSDIINDRLDAMLKQQQRKGRAA